MDEGEELLPSGGTAQGPQPQGEEMNELFGDDDDLMGPQEDTYSAPVQPTKKPTFYKSHVERVVPRGESERLKLVELKEPENASKIHVVRVPNVVGLEETHFHAQSYVPPERTGKISWIRWRIVYDPNDPTKQCQYKESNSRLVTWSDGSKSLVIGKEVFDIEESVFPQNAHYLYAEATQAELTTPDKVYKAQGPVYSKMHIKTVDTGRGNLLSDVSQGILVRGYLKDNRRTSHIALGHKIAKMKEERKIKDLDLEPPMYNET
eukprot:UN23559